MNKQEQALKPCPFCGRDAHIAHSRDGDTARVICTFWPVCMGSGSWKNSNDEAIAVWNSRVALQPTEQQCGCCGGAGRMVRDPDIGTDQECFACGGTGMVEDEQPEDERERFEKNLRVMWPNICMDRKRRNPDEYASDSVQSAWINWQAAKRDVPAQELAALTDEPKRMTIDQSREYLVGFMERHFADKTFHRYIRGDRDGARLAGDFAWQMVHALRMIDPAQGAVPIVPFGTYVERTDGTKEFRRTGDVFSPSPHGGQAWVLYAGVAPARDSEQTKRIAELEGQVATMRAAFHVNMMRAYPSKSHAEITEAIDTALRLSDQPAAIYMHAPVAVKWAGYFLGNPDFNYTPGFLTDWKLYDDKDKCERDLFPSGELYCARQIWVYDRPISSGAAGQPAPEEQSSQDARDAIREAIAKSLTSAYVCGRVWDAWHVGTMTEDDFTPAADSDEVLDEITDAVLAELAQRKG